MTLPVFDLLLLTLLLYAAWNSYASARLFTCVVSFICFGGVLAVAWLRLGAPDVALAEAAVGAGVTGALLMATVGHINRQPIQDEG